MIIIIIVLLIAVVIAIVMEELMSLLSDRFHADTSNRLSSLYRYCPWFDGVPPSSPPDWPNG